MSALTDAQRAELVAIAGRDAMANEMWFIAPRGSFTAAAARDRRTLLELVRTLQAENVTLRLELEDYPPLPDAEDDPLCACGAFAMHDGRVLHAPSCKAIPA